MKKKIELILFIILIFILIFVVYLKFIVRVKNIEVFGYNFFIVKTGSMEPNISVGEFIIVKKQKEYKKNEIITYKEDEVFITHRIIEKDGNTYITKGDSNNEKDLEIKKENVIGKIVFHSKVLGIIITKYLFYIIIFYVGINIIVYFISFNKNNNETE